MSKNYLLGFLFLSSSTYAQYISEDKILVNQNSYQLSSCKDFSCVKRTENLIQDYDYITILEKKYYVTHIVNLDNQKVKKAKKDLRKYFPDMILRKKAPKIKNLVYPKINNKKSIQKNKIDNASFISKYKLALENFKKKRYEQSYTQLNELFNIKSDNLNINFYLGRSAYETKRYDQAVSAFERFLFEEPNNNRVKVEMARSFFMTKTYKESKKLLLEVKKDSKIPATTLKVVNHYLRMIDKKISKHNVSGILMLGIIKDSNINSRSNHESFSNVYVPSSDIYLDLTNSTEGADNWYNQEVALLTHKYKLDDTKNIRQDFLIYNKDSFDSAYDSTKVTLYSYSPALSVKHNEKLTIDYSLYTDYLRYGQKDKLKTYAVIPKFDYKYDKNNKITGYFKYQMKDDEQDSTQNSIYKELQTKLLHTFNKQMALTSTFTLYDETAKDSTQTGIDYTAIKGTVSFNYKYTPRLFIAPSLTYSISQYDDVDANYLVKKKNKQKKFALSTTYVYSPKLIIQGKADYTNQHSTIAPSEYDKYTFGLNLIRPF